MSKHSSSAAIRRLIDNVVRDASASSPKPSTLAAKEVLDATGALLVYSDMGGALAITPEGVVVGYDFDSKNLQDVDENWRLVALRQAARKFDELKSLEPPRPDNSVCCPACSGRGTVTMGDVSLDCGVCWGGGWVV